MANDSYSQQSLGADPNFHRRVRAALSSVAWQVLNEADAVPNHDAREKYARSVISNLDTMARQIAQWLVHRPNLMAFETSYSFPGAAVVTAAGDADIESQLMTDWNELSGTTPGPIVP